MYLLYLKTHSFLGLPLVPIRASLLGSTPEGQLRYAPAPLAADADLFFRQFAGSTIDQRLSTDLDKLCWISCFYIIYCIQSNNNIGNDPFSREDENCFVIFGLYHVWNIFEDDVGHSILVMEGLLLQSRWSCVFSNYSLISVLQWMH